jgi:multicomponent Na+:H+ antiporter subunit B
MHLELEISLLVFLLIAAVISLQVKDLLTAVVMLNIYSFISALIFVAMGAVDVGFTEAVVGAGITGVLFVVFILHTSRKSSD